MTQQPPTKPAPIAPIHIIRGAGLNAADAEARSRIVALILPHSRGAIDSTEALIEVAEWILLGPDDEEDPDA